MEKPFFERLNEYYQSIGKDLQNKSDTAVIFPNPTDKGTNREQIYLDFLIKHAPSGCNIFKGGYLFNKKGQESKQIDIIITSDTSPQYKFSNVDNTEKSFACIEGTLAIISVKSNLTSAELVDCLKNFGSIPEKEPLDKQLCSYIKIADYDDWPYKIIFAYDSVGDKALIKTLNEFYEENSDIPMNKRPNFIHVVGKGVIIRIPSYASVENLEPNSYRVVRDSTDVYGLAYVQFIIQQKTMVSRHLMYKYFNLIDGMNVVT